MRLIDADKLVETIVNTPSEVAKFTHTMFYLHLRNDKTKFWTS